MTAEVVVAREESKLVKKCLFLIGLIITALVTGGCGMNIPDTAAFQDEFTRGFMKSSEEVEEGYYLFESGTGGFTMLFPKNATMDRAYYQKPSNGYERIFLGETTDDNFSYYITLKYENRGTTERIETQLKLLNIAVNYDGKYDEFEYGNKTFYYARNNNHVKSGDKERTHFRFFSYIKSNENHQGIEVVYSVACSTPDNTCEIDIEKQEEIAKTLMKSIQFHEH